MSDYPGNIYRSMDVSRPKGGWGEPVKVQSQPPAPRRAEIHTASQARAPHPHHDHARDTHDHFRPRVPAHAPPAQPERKRKPKPAVVRTRADFARSARGMTAREARGQLLAMTAISVAILTASGAGLITATRSVPVSGHRGMTMSTSEYISRDTPVPVRTATAISVALGFFKQTPNNEVPVYHALRNWAHIVNPSARDSDESLRQTYNFAALDQLDHAAVVSLPRFIAGVKTSIAADHNPLTNAHDKAAYAFLTELDKIRPEYQQKIAAAFNPLTGFSPETSTALTGMFDMASQGQPITMQLARYRAELKIALHNYEQTRTFFQNARQNGLLYCMGLAERVTGVALIQDQLTVSSRESGISIDQMWRNIAGQSANGAEQLTDKMVTDLVGQYGKKAFDEIQAYEQAHPDLSASDKAWLDLSKYQLQHGASAKQFKENYVLAFVLNHLSLEHDRVGLVRALTNQFGMSETELGQYVSRPEQLSLINFAGLGRAQKMAAAYIAYKRNPVAGNDIKLSRFMTPAVLKRNHLSGNMGIKAFFAQQIEPWRNRWAGFSLHLRHDVDTAMLEAPAPLQRGGASPAPRVG